MIPRAGTPGRRLHDLKRIACDTGAVRGVKNPGLMGFRISLQGA